MGRKEDKDNEDPRESPSSTDEDESINQRQFESLMFRDAFLLRNVERFIGFYKNLRFLIEELLSLYKEIVVNPKWSMSVESLRKRLYTLDVRKYRSHFHMLPEVEQDSSLSTFSLRLRRDGNNRLIFVGRNNVLLELVNEEEVEAEEVEAESVNEGVEAELVNEEVEAELVVSPNGDGQNYVVEAVVEAPVTLVFDIGRKNTKIQSTVFQTPFIVPSVFLKTPYKHTATILKICGRTTIVGSEALRMKHVSGSRFCHVWPEDDIVSLDCAEFFDQLIKEFFSFLNVEQARAVITGDTTNPDVKKTLIQIFLNHGFDQVAWCPHELAACHSFGVDTATVLSIGLKTTSLGCVYEDSLLHHSSITSKIGGSTISEYLSLLVDAPHLISPNVSNSVSDQLKHAVCFVSLSYTNDLLIEDEHRVVHYLESGDFLEVSSPRFKAPEVLFQPDMYGSREKGISDLLNDQLDQLDPVYVKDLRRVLVIIGRTASLPNVMERMKDMMQWYDTEVMVDKDGTATWRGCRQMLSEGRMNDLFMSQFEYQQNGKEVTELKEPW